MEFVREVPTIVLTEAPSKESPLVLECELSRMPKDEPKWLQNNKALPSVRYLPKGLSVESDKASTVHRLVFTEIASEQLGEYTLQAENIASTGSVEMKSELNALFLVTHETRIPRC